MTILVTFIGLATSFSFYSPLFLLSLPTLAEFRALASPLLAELDCAFGDYELAERCPTLLFQSKK